MPSNPTPMAARVFVVAPGMQYDTRSASEYGEIRYLLDAGGMSPMDPMGTANKVMESLEKQGFDPAKDFVCMTAPSNIVGYVMGAMACGWAEFTILLFDARTRRYIARKWSDPCVR